MRPSLAKKIESFVSKEIEGERWAPVAGADGYEISDHGRLRSYRQKGSLNPFARTEPKMMRPNVVDKGSKSTLHYVYRDNDRIMRRHAAAAMVLEGFGFPKPGPSYTFMHVNRDGWDNYLGNLRWMERGQKISMGIRNSGREERVTEPEMISIIDHALACVLVDRSFYTVSESVGVSWDIVLASLRGDRFRDKSAEVERSLGNFWRLV